MSEAKHTPGPWRTSREDMESYTVNPDGETGDTVHVVYVYRDDAPRIPVFADRRTDNARADARLIAAAPDLLAAVKLALLTRASDAETRAFLRAAARKAEG